MLNQVQFTYKRFVELSVRASINQYDRFKILEEITPTLIRHRVLQDFAATCFGHFLRFDSIVVFSSILVHNLLAREITFDGIGDSELWLERRSLHGYSHLAEDLEQFNRFSWGKFVFQITLHYLKVGISSPPSEKNKIQ